MTPLEENPNPLAALELDRVGRTVTITCADDETAEQLVTQLRLFIKTMAFMMDLHSPGGLA